MSRLLMSLLISLGVASSASAVTMEWTPIGHPANACDPQSQGCFGAVGYAYAIGTYEVTNAQYAEFLNAKAATDPLGLYNTSMSSGFGGITRSGSSDSYTYTAIAGRENMPVNYVSIINAMRFANWINNGQGNGDTETGSYMLLSGGFNPSNGQTVTPKRRRHDCPSNRERVVQGRLLRLLDRELLRLPGLGRRDLLDTYCDA